MKSQISFEIGSKCDVAKVEQVYLALNATQVFITWRPNETIDQLRETCGKLADKGMNVVPHVVARNLASTNQLQQLLRELSEKPSISSILLLGGDAAHASGPYASAVDVIATELLPTTGFQKVYFAGYPQGHGLISKNELDLSLNKKIELARDLGLRLGVITQLCSSASAAINWALSTTEQFEIEVRISIPIGEKAVIKQRLKQIYKTSMDVECGEHVSAGALAFLESACAQIKAKNAKINLHLIPFQKLDLLLRHGNTINTMLQSELS